ncbi:uncharacterized protein LOC111348778 [Spodoptera litura]|uniref:Uncharacterized protein LOC111348778 n=1 Tax=Spodoptera litura TaxID=69820 RepID=A0A9J7IJP0_SPOLT|nr:uncharacterized protein LOC111348778 [Spodoptera litura]
MLHQWLIITFSWLGTVRPQYINSGASNGYTLTSVDSNIQYPIPYYFNLPSSRNDYETVQNIPPNIPISPYENNQPDLPRKRRAPKEQEEIREKRWLSNMVDMDQTLYGQEEQLGNPGMNSIEGALDENGTNLLNVKDKKYFSPWGGKRDKASIEHMWTWKRASNIREPSMPKRVRFSPWGGKRSGQMIYKPGSKSSKIIFSTTIPELTRIVSNYSPNGNERFNFAGFQFIPTLDKRHPIKILALSTKTDERTLREAMPFKSFLESLPKIFKPGHPYLDVNLKKDGKRKVKFSAWGGKRSPPIIGPIWTPAPQNLKESTLDTILLIRNSQDKDDSTLKAL